MERLDEKKSEISSLLKSEIISSIEGLEFIARIIVEEYFHGNNLSHKLGMGQEFSQYRSYEPGDDLRLLDWKMYARSERYYIRQSEIDTHITIRFILDTSKSMDHESDGITKLNLAKILVASLSYMARNQGDAFGLFTVNKQNIHRLSPNIHPQQFIRLLKMLLQVKSESTWPEDTISMEDIYLPGRKEMVVFLTDMYETNSELMDFIYSLKSNRNEVLVLHILAGNEANFNFEGFHTFKDLETGEEVLADSNTARRHYLREYINFKKKVADALMQKEVDYHAFSTHEDLPKVMFEFLQARKRLL